MCGRYVSPDEAAAQRYWEQKHSDFPFKPGWDAGRFDRTNYNVTPSRLVMVERIGPDGPELTGMRWGMDRENWQTGTVEVAKLNNARIEGVRRIKPFAEPFKTGKRGCQLVQGYYEWKDKKFAGVKIPYYIYPTDQGEVFALACVYDYSIKDPSMLTCSVITMPAAGRLSEIDERMPAILRLEDHETWMKGTPEEAFACLRPYPDDKLFISRVKRAVNSNRAQGADLVEPDPGPELTPEEEARENAREKIVEPPRKPVDKLAEKKRKEEDKLAAKKRKEEERAAAREQKAAEREAEKTRKAREQAEAKRNGNGQGNLF